MSQTSAHKRKDLTPELEQAWRIFSKAIFAPGALAHSQLAFEAYDNEGQVE
ncbi:hypothetical protein [Salinisphaera sp. LB1]|uniref:hypothetical protein n=1 Tax=Salinisphaera sp. LB1 TaxID=2183911 RepID=UPI000D7E3479|nr:hypothetical protein [Salinisphaera sp. LB1]AWN17917.1 hypothetical protein SALB1_3725 [Salinisphaera sp. LB1]